MEIKNAVVLVSGANRGMGRSLVLALIENGAKKVYAGARDVSSLDGLIQECGETVVPVQLDVTDDESVQKVAALATDVEILFNNAGVLVPGGFEAENTMEGLKNNLEVNVVGVTRLTKAFLPILKEKDSAAIVTTASAAALANMPTILTYSASKAAVHSLIQGLRGELKESNIKVLGVYPGPVETDMVKEFGMTNLPSSESVAQKIVEGVKNEEEYIFPDEMSANAGATYMKSPKSVEDQFGS